MTPEYYDVSFTSKRGVLYQGVVVKQERLQRMPSDESLEPFLEAVKAQARKAGRVLSSRKIHVVYSHREEGSQNPSYYIGKGKGRRPMAHFWEDSLRKRSYKNNIIAKAFHEGRKIFVEILYKGLSDELACALEMYLIAHFGRKNTRTGVLTNLTDGGDGTSGAILSEEHKRQIGERHRGKNHTDESKRLISESLKGRAKSRATRDRIRKAKRGLLPSEAARRNHRAAQNTPEIREYRSARRRVSEPELVERMAQNNPLFRLVAIHVKPAHSIVACKHCGCEVVLTNSRLMNGYMPRSHRECSLSL